MPYDLFEHRHRFSVWAAARAAQRGFTSVDRLRDALGKTDIREFVLHHVEEAITDADFKERHGAWCDTIFEFLVDSGVSNVSFGRAAKLVAVYIKAMVVVGPHSETQFALVAHPPIDSILLGGIADCDNLPGTIRQLCRSTKWTQLERSSYYSIVDQIKAFVPDIEPFWRLERYWTVTQDADS